MTFDPYTNRVQWELLTEEERKSFEWVDIENVLVWNGLGWRKEALASFCPGIIYRLAQPRIDYCFDLFDDKFEWAATQENGTVFQYEMKPIKTALAWKNSGGAMVALPKYLKRFPTLPDSVSWENSLRRRGEA